MSRLGSVLKRLAVGRPLTSSKLEHQLLPKTLALPVFSSDPLSSVAYATEEMMLVLVVAGSAALSLMLPIAGAIAVVLAIVIVSYRQTVRAYPRGGGSYIVAKENLGTVPGLTAAAAILLDYILTVAVSSTAGTVAVVSAVPALEEHRVAVALGFVSFVALVNLRGTRESGILFAIPTYGFVVTIYVLLFSGIAACLDGCPQAATAGLPLEVEHGLGLFIILRAFSSGSTALTGVEAIADGVQAFRRPRSRNAATTLAVMGGISISMFLGITWLARNLGVRVTEEIAESSSVLSQIGRTVFGDDAVMFFVLQAFTALILILAANTAFQDFPRLSAILARDGFLPRQFLNRGDRLVYSNGIAVLSVVAGLLVWAFGANLTALIQLYVVGVFTAFTLSQAGMVRYWLRERTPGWRRSAAINAIGASATGVVLVIVTITKFARGAWIVIVAMPVIVAGHLWVRRHYDRVRAGLTSGADPEPELRNTMLVLVEDFGPATRDAISWLRSVRPERVRALWVGPVPAEDVRARWEELAPRLGDLEDFRGPKDQLARRLRREIRETPRGEGDLVTVVIPEEVSTGLVRYLARRPPALRIKTALLFEPGVVVVDLPFVPAEREAFATRTEERPLETERNVCIVPVSGVHRGTLRALAFARSLQPARLEAFFLAGEPEEADALLEAWRRAGVEVPLTIVEAPFREYGPPTLEEIRRFTRRPGTTVTVILPEFVVERWWHQLLHNQRALYFKRLLLFEPGVVAVSVPYHLGREPAKAPS